MTPPPVRRPAHLRTGPWAGRRFDGVVRRVGRAILRPKVADLEFRLYDRPLHPELFDTLALRRVSRDGSVLTVRVTPTGHVLGWARHEACLTELITTADLDLPGCRLTYPFAAERRGRCRVAPGVRYEVGLQLEVLPPDVFLHVHEELAADGARSGLIFHFRPQHRLGLTPLGYVTATPVRTGLSIAAFHTFPDEFAIVKTQSLIELDD